MKRLSQDLARRFGKRAFYSSDEVTKAAERGGYTTVFIAYAHAAFCSREVFDEHYGPLGVKCTYDGLRKEIAKRYFSNQTHFDAEMVFLKFRPQTLDDNFHESGIAE